MATTTIRRAQIGGEIRRLRKRNGLSQGELGSAVGRDSSFISRVERGQRPISADCLMAIYDALDVVFPIGLPRSPEDRNPAKSSEFRRVSNEAAAPPGPGPDEPNADPRLAELLAAIAAEHATHLREIVQHRVEAEGLHPLARRTGLGIGQIRSICAGRAPLLSTVCQVCAALGLELSIGPPRHRTTEGSESAAPAISVDRLRDLEKGAIALNRHVLELGGDPIPPDLRVDLPGGHRIAESHSKYSYHPADDPAGRPVEIIELAASAGGGADTADERIIGRVWFPRDWLDRRGLDPTQCALLGVQGESMEPTLMPGASILVARNRRRRRKGRIYVMRTGDDLIVKRIDKGHAGWQLVSDHPSWQPVPWPTGVEIIGEVVWVARTLEEC